LTILLAICVEILRLYGCYVVAQFIETRQEIGCLVDFESSNGAGGKMPRIMQRRILNAPRIVERLVASKSCSMGRGTRQTNVTLNDIQTGRQLSERRSRSSHLEFNPTDDASNLFASFVCPV
jgi:hypothetical protein